MSIVKNIQKYHFKWIILIGIITGQLSCEDALEPDFPKELYINQYEVFDTANNAEAAARGMYQQMLTPGHPFYTSLDGGISTLAGMSADELLYLLDNNADLTQFNTNMLLAENGKVEDIWKGFYQSIFTANGLLVNLSNTDINPELVTKLRGEALFVRAISYFHLVNFFGDIPLVLNNNYLENANIARSPASKVYAQIESDLLESIVALPDTYEAERTRPIKATAKAFLARVYLYQENWQEAIDLATEIINDTSTYELVDLNNIVQVGNREALWQLHISKPLANNPVTNEGTAFISSTALFFRYSQLQESLVTIFEPGDLRKDRWVYEYLPDVYLPYKYKRGNVTDPGPLEYTTVMRLAEVYLIRAEAYARTEQNMEALMDLDALRGRAGLSLLAETQPELSGEVLLQQILQERQAELFTEWGHRWLDLKRTGKALEVLSPIKPGIDENDLLWPIPQLEINNNPALRGHQNPGY
ncbi:SusD family protein [Sinomicrobium oceani]|uniref:SusD family protein n=1 Tax=Sinomicrobium oceani TaxID=1150368 RepID=A0A1K1RWW5_9FLAO|nr:RagB/SusD family nutrient uptake outer membrane protein [Sinomicrobium oceani]SFW76309.1 SusD family protein [Sinomicrobium oceani]